MIEDKVTVVIPVLKGRDWNKERSLHLPDGTPYVIAEYDEPDEWASAMNQGVEAADTDLVILSSPETWFERLEGEAVDLLTNLAWDCDVTYGNFVQWQDGEPRASIPGEMFCAHRLRLENYLPPYACVRKQKFLEVGGINSGLWDLWIRMLDAGARFKYVPEAVSARDGAYEDASGRPPGPPEPQATFYYQSTPGTAYWRCLVPSRHLPGVAVFNLPKRVVTDGKLSMPGHRGTAVFQFAGNLEHMAVIRHLQTLGHRVLLEVDDTYAHWHPGQMKKAGWTEKTEGNNYSVECHRATAKVVDGVIVTTETLAKQYRKLNENVFVCGNQIDPADWPELEKPDDGKFRIGWFASGSHAEDGRLIERACDWASSQPDVEIQMIGTGATKGKPWYSFPFMHRPWSNDFGVYRRFLMELDVGLCPVKPTPWAVCRSDLKTLEYGMAQAYPVVSDVPPYETVDVPHAKTPKDFLRIVQELVRNRDETKEKARKWREYVLRERTIQANIGLWRQAVAG